MKLNNKAIKEDANELLGKNLSNSKKVMGYILVLLFIASLSGVAQATRYRVQIDYRTATDGYARQTKRTQYRRPRQVRRDKYEKRIGNNRKVVWRKGRAYYRYD